METRDVDLRYINRSDPREKLAGMGLFPVNNEMKDVDLRYINSSSDPREELAAMGLLPINNEVKEPACQQENEIQIKDPAAELAAMGLLPQENFGGRPDETEYGTHRERRDVSATSTYGSRKQMSPNRLSRKRSSSPSSSSRKRTPPKEKMDNVTRTNPDRGASVRNFAFSPDDACNMLMVICDKLGIIGVSFKSVLKRALEFEPDTHKMLKVFQEADTLSLMEVVSQKINDSALNPKNDYDKEIMKKASIYIRTLIEKSKQECSEIIHGIDVSRLAHITLGKETKYIISMIRTEFEHIGVYCPQSILSEIFQKVSMRHFSIMKSNENHNNLLANCNSLDIKTDLRNPKLPSYYSVDKVGVSDLIRSETRQQEPLGLTESLIQVNDNKLNSDRGHNQYEKGFAQNLPYKGNSRERDGVDRKFRDMREVEGRLHTDDRGFIRERNSADRKFTDTREKDRKQDQPYRNERDMHKGRSDFDERKRGNNRERNSVDGKFTDTREKDRKQDQSCRNERDVHERRYDFDERNRGNYRERNSVDEKFTNTRERNRRQELPYRNERDVHGRRYDFDDRRSDSRERANVNKTFRDIQEIDTRKDGLQENLPNRNEREYQERRKRFVEGDHSHRYERNKESRNVEINQNRVDSQERETYKRNGPVLGNNFRDGRGHLNHQDASRKNKPHRDLEDINKELKIRNHKPKFWEGFKERKNDENITKKVETPEKVTPEEDTPKLPTIKQMMEDLEKMQAMAEAEKEAQLPEDEINEDPHWLPEEELNEEQYHEESCNDDTEDKKINEENFESGVDTHDNDDDDNLKETFGNKDIGEVPWQELVKKLAPEGMIKPTDIEVDENLEDDPEHDNDYLNDYGNSGDNNYGSENYNQSEYNHNMGPDDHYMNSYGDYLNEDTHYDDQNSGNDRNDNSGHDLMIAEKFIKDRSSNNENMFRNDPNYLQENRTQFPNYRGEYESGHQYNETQNYVDQRVGSEHEHNSNAEYDYSYGKMYGEEAAQSTNNYYRENSDKYNSYDYSSEAHRSYDYTGGTTAYSGGPPESQSYSQMTEANSYDYANQNAQPYPSGYNDETLYQSGYQPEYKDESAYQQQNEPYKNPYNDSGYEAESSEYSLEMPVEFIKPKKTLDDSLQNSVPPQNPSSQNSSTWLADQIKALATSNLGKEELAARMAQIFNSQKSDR